MHSLDAFASAAVLQLDRTGRLFAALQKPQLHIAVLGGSISYGYTLTQAVQPYPERIVYPMPHTIRSFAAAGTDALMGQYLTERYLADNPPDLVFVEYAVNQMPTSSPSIAYESLLRRLLSFPTKPAVIPIMCCMQNGASAAAVLNRICETYGLPLISIADGLRTIPWDAYSDDTVHPNDSGHAHIAAAVQLLLQNTVRPLPECALPQPMLGAELLTCLPMDILTGGLRQSSPYLQLFADDDAVLLTPDYPTLAFAVSGQAVLLCYRQSADVDTANAILTINGHSPTSIHARVLSGWGNPMLCRIPLPAGTHTVQLSPDSCDGRFLLWGLAVFP